MTSNDAQLTIDEDAQLYKLNKIIAERTERMTEYKEKYIQQIERNREILGF